MSKLIRGDESWTFLCSWCGRAVREEDITETLDGSGLCPNCIVHYNADQDEEDGTVMGFISNIDRE
jgi:hypothetical protein